MLLTIFQGSKPTAASTTPTRIDSRISRNATVSGEPPRKRYRPSLVAAGNSRVSFGISMIPRTISLAHYSQCWGDGEPACRRQWPPAAAPDFDTFSSREPVFTPRIRSEGLPCWKTLRLQNRIRLQHPLQGFQPVGLAWRLVPAQPVDAREPHRNAGFMPRRACQAFEGDLQHQPLVRLMHHMPDRSEFFDCVAAHEAIDLQQLLVGEAEIGLADRHQLLAILAGGPDPERIIRIIGRTLAVAALRIHQHGIDDVRVALPLPPLSLRATRQIGGLAALEHHALNGLGICARAGGIGAC